MPEDDTTSIKKEGKKNQCLTEDFSTNQIGLSSFEARKRSA